MPTILKVVKEDKVRYIKDINLPEYQQGGWTIAEELEVTISTEGKTDIVKKNKKVAEQGD